MAITAAPLAQWLFNEAASGDGIATIVDNITSPSAADLTRTQGAGTADWATIGAGRGYDFASATSGFYISRSVGGTKLALSGKTKIAVQLVVKVVTGNDASAPILSVGGDADFLVRHTGNTASTELFVFANDTRVRTISDGTISAGSVGVLTIIHDTTQASANDRHRVHWGTPLIGSVNANLAQNATMSWNDAVEIGEYGGAGNQWRGAIAYAAVYVDDEVDTLSAELADHVAALEADNDVAPGSGGGGGPTNFFSRLTPTVRLTPTARLVA